MTMHTNAVFLQKGIKLIYKFFGHCAASDQRQRRSKSIVHAVYTEV